MLAGGCPTAGRGAADDAPLRNASARRPNSTSGFFAGGVALAVEFAELGVSAGGAANESAASKSSAAFAGFGGAGAAPGAGDTAERGCEPRFGGPDAGSGLTWACCGWATGWGCIGLGAAGSGAADATGAGRSAGLGRSPVAGSSEMIFRIEAKISSMDGSVAVCARDIAYPLANPNTPDRRAGALPSVGSLRLHSAYKGPSLPAPYSRGSHCLMQHHDPRGIPGPSRYNIPCLDGIECRQFNS